jgi:hypothetical protein
MSIRNNGEQWYHGSPYELTTIRKGSTITQDINLARIFSHKPSCVCIEDNGDIKHNGVLEGYLYSIDEVITEGDVYPHPRTTMQEGMEWLTNRELRLQLIEKTVIREEEKLSEEDIKALMEFASRR